VFLKKKFIASKKNFFSYWLLATLVETTANIDNNGSEYLIK